MDSIELIAALDHPNVRAFLRMLRHGEGTAGENGYRVQFGGGLFDSFADHPRQAITRSLGGKPITSTAAGAYQFLSRTWDGLVKQYGFADFGPKNQDLGAVALIAGRGALQDVMAGRFEQAVVKCNREWASLPGSPYGQPVVTMARARQEYETHGGQYADPAPTAATPGLARFINPEALAADTITPKETTMAPFIAAVLPSLIDLVPKLGKLFSSGSDVSERNVKAAEIVVAAAKEAIGARNEQELLETIKADPNAAQLVRQAIEANWFKVDEVGGGIQAARVANDKFMQPGAVGFWMNPAFWLSLVMLAMPFMLLVDVFFLHPYAYDGNLRVQIVTGVLMVISIVGGYWLGTSFSSQRKTELGAVAPAQGRAPGV